MQKSDTSIRHRLVGIAALAPILGIALLPAVTHAHPSEARLKEVIPWSMPHIAESYSLSYAELGPGGGGNRVSLWMRSVENQLCATGALLGFDVDDTYAFDIDESVQLTLTYAPAYTGSFAVQWDANGGGGYGRKEVEVESGDSLRQVTLTLERARFAGQGAHGIDIAIQGRDGLAICGIEIARSETTIAPQSFGQIQLQILDEATGRSVPARVGLYDETGRLPLPSENALLVQRFSDDVRRLRANDNAFWPSTNRQVFYVDGNYEASVPVGTYEVVVARGMEYHAHRSQIEILPGETTTLDIELSRYADLASRGWYSGDGHVHIGRDQVDDLVTWAFAAAEDVRVTNLLQMGNLARTHFTQPAWGEAGRFMRDGYVVLSGQEDPRTVQHGHTIHHNLQEPIHLPTDNYFNYQEAFERANEQGGVSGYAHHGQLFNGRRGLAVDVPFGLVDFIEVLQNGRLGVEPWYDYLNLGYKILPVAGSDYPYMDLPGVVRNYVKVDGEFTVDAYFEAFGEGNTYVTNGPFIEMSVNGQPMGSELSVDRGEMIEIIAHAELNPEVDALSHLELVVHGEVVATVEAAPGESRVTLRTEISADYSQWIAIRAWGSRQEERSMTVAHSAPAYILVDDQPFWKREWVSEIVERQLVRLDEFVTDLVDPRGDLEPWETLHLHEQEWERQLASILGPRLSEARNRYMLLLERAMMVER